jgi:hypothetical protein
LPAGRQEGTQYGNKIEIPISNIQIPNNSQSPNDQIPTQIHLDYSKLEFEYCLGFGAWKLVLPWRGRYACLVPATPG